MNKSKYIIIGLVVVFALIFLHRAGTLQGVENSILNIIKPVGKVFNIGAGSGEGIFSTFSNIRSLQNENAGLKEEIGELEAEIVRLEEFRKENETLKRDLDFRVSSGFNTVSATVFLRDPSSARQLLYIDKGKRDGIVENMIVTSEGSLVGKITEVLEDSSRISLIIDPSSGIPAIVSNSTASGLARGQLGFGLALEKVPQADIIKEGQLVLTSGLGGDFPKGILIGQVEKISSVGNEVFQEATIRPGVNFSRLERVLVIIGEK